MSIRVNGKIIASNGDIKTEVSTDNLVTLDTNQTITSSKTFTIEPLKKSTTVDITVENPETYQQNDAFRVQDKNGKDMGWFGCGQLTSGEIHTTIHSKNKDGYSSIVAACVPQSGTTGAYAYAPNTPENAPDNAIVTVDYVKDKSGSLSIMDVVFAPLGIDESKNKRRYLNGQVIIQSQFPAFTSAVKARMTTMANAFTTETNWQAEKTNSKLGQCGKFVVDDTAGTIRLPCVVNAQGLVDLTLIGGIKSESLPNITGSVASVPGLSAPEGIYSGAFQKGDKVNEFGGNGNYYGVQKTLFSAGLSSSTYQDNAPVQQEAIQYPYVIVVNTGVEEAERPINNYQVNNVYSYGMSQYYKGDMNNLSWLKSAGQWNSSTVYAGMYNWLVEQVNAGKSGFVASTATYTDYDFVINTTDQTFRLPLLNGQEGIFADKTVPSDYSLYYYVGDTLQNASLINVARIEEKLTDVNAASRGYLVESYHNGTEWYRVYSDGWIEQGGEFTQSSPFTLTFPKAFTTTSYVISLNASDTTPDDNNLSVTSWKNKTATGVKIYISFQGIALSNQLCNWIAFGY